MPEDILLDREDGPSLRQVFLHQAHCRPQAPALQLGQRQVSYGQLLDRAGQWADALLAALGRPPRRVGVFAHRSETAYTGVVAALLSGAAYVPLNRTFPLERTRSMIARAQLDALIVDAASAPQLAPVLEAGGPSLILAPDGPLEVEGVEILDGQGPGRSHWPPVASGDLAYLLFTSGSTGEPKGVGISQANILHFLGAVQQRYGIGPEDRLSQTFDLTFDLSVFDLFAAWQGGACVCVPQALDLLSPARFVQRQQITVWFSVPSLPQLMRRKNLLEPESMPTLRWSLFCGEPLPQGIARVWQAAAPYSTVENLYGPTELTLACLWHRWEAAQEPQGATDAAVAIGRPLPGLTALVLDEEGQPAPKGQAGELWVGGPQTAPGYWRDEALTVVRFTEMAGMRGYCTGDRVRQRPDGIYEYLGRSDQQIKVLGHRVELGEIEAALRQVAGLDQVAALGWPWHQGSAQGIVAFAAAADLDQDKVREQLAGLLPAYMVPSRLLPLDSLPLNANGKIDRAALEVLLQAAG
ncbi:MAG: amino acid adenylation domain-containing protein [Candidatus Latescibacteria bacterium]|nr:amino acid adenylation domain-containing protein [Candidatus Latescibacterota bacterium]